MPRGTFFSKWEGKTKKSKDRCERASVTPLLLSLRNFSEKGKWACGRRDARLERLDKLILKQRVSRIFDPERLETIPRELVWHYERKSVELQAHAKKVLAGTTPDSGQT